MQSKHEANNIQVKKGKKNLKVNLFFFFFIFLVTFKMSLPRALTTVVNEAMEKQS